MKTNYTLTINFRGALLDVEVEDHGNGETDFQAYYKGVNSDEYPNGIPVNGLFFDMKLTYELGLAVEVAIAERNMDAAQLSLAKY